MAYPGKCVRIPALACAWKASLSPAGFELVRNLMRINGFLGDLVELPLLMNEFSYNFALYAETEPWGWQLFGHHAVLNCLLAGSQLVLSPVFMGAEPDMIDAGPHRGVKVFKERISLARQLMVALPAELRGHAVAYASMVDPAMPEGRLHPGDERHLGGCFQDNRVIPYEGIRVTDMPSQARDLLDAVVDDFIAYLPDRPRAARRREIREHYGETFFSWIGGWEVSAGGSGRPGALFRGVRLCRTFQPGPRPARGQRHCRCHQPQPRWVHVADRRLCQRPHHALETINRCRLTGAQRCIRNRAAVHTQ